MKQEDIKKLNIYEKMSAITNELGVVAKNLNVDMGKGKSYKAVQEKDILDAVKPLEDKYRVYSYPTDSNITDRDVLVKESEYNGNITRTNTLFMRLERVYRFINIDNPTDYMDIKSYGDGLDTGDKAPGKAMTYADKYALMKAYKIATGDDPDKDASPEKGYRQPQDTNLINEFERLVIETESDKQEIYKYFKVNDITELDNAKLQLAIDILKRKVK